VDARSTPADVAPGYLPDEGANLGILARSPSSLAALPTPIQAESLAVPADHRRRVHDRQGRPPLWPHPSQPTQNARSTERSFERFARRRRTASCCRRARFSSASVRRDLRLDRAAESIANKSVLMVRGDCSQPREPQGSRAARGFEDPQPDSWIDDIVFDTNDATEAGSATLLHRGDAEDGNVPCESWSFAGPLDSQSRQRTEHAPTEAA